MGASIGNLGTVTWSTGVHAQLAGTGTQPREWTLDLEGDELDTTVLGNTGAMTAIPGLQSWSGSFKALLKVPAYGNGGLVTFAAGYTVNLNSWDMSIVRDVIDTTIFNATSPTVKSFIPGLFKWSGSFSGFLDDTTLAIFPGTNSLEPAAATFKYQEKGATDNSLAGSILTTRTNIGVKPSAANSISYSWRGTGDVTQSTPSAGTGIITAGALGLQAASTLTLTSDATRTFSGSAFWKSIGIRVVMGQLVELDVGFAGTGSLSIS